MTEQSKPAANQHLLATGQHVPAFSSWLEYQLRNWDSWAEEQDGAWLAVPTGNASFPSIGHLMRHAFSPLHRYSDQVAGAEPLDDQAVAVDNWKELSSHAWRCLLRHRSVSTGLDPARWGERYSFKTRSAGVLEVAIAESLSHAATHCVWHLGGAIHLLRAAGIQPPQRSDFIFAVLTPNRP